MKIGILTFHRSFNYGAFMQCYSLSSKLTEIFPNCEIEVVDYTSKKALAGYEQAIQRASNQNKCYLKARNHSFLPCQELLPLSPKKIVSDEMDDIVSYLNDNYDILVVGSDAVWNWEVRGFPNVYFLKDFNGKKISYAASAHGLIYQNSTSLQKEYLREAFSQFQYLGVRDVTTENMVKYANPSLCPVHNCDPTMFLDISKVPCDISSLQEKMRRMGVDFSKPLIGLMAGNSIGYEIKKKWGDSVQLVALYSPNKYADVYLYDLNPFEWAHVFSFFKLTITHFFHGTMLSLVNHVPVIPIEFISGFSAVNTTKIHDLMTRLELLDWRFTIDETSRSFIQKVMEKMQFHFNNQVWRKVNERIDDMLHHDYSSLIEEKVNKERQSADSFFEKMTELINSSLQ